MMPLVYESEEAMEAKKQAYHWRIAEERWTLNEQLRERNAKELYALSYKALRSIIVKQIQNRLAKFNNDPSTIIKEGPLEKKSDHGFSWAQRYCVMNGKEFRYYHTRQEAKNPNSQPLCSFLLRNMYSIMPLNEGTQNKAHVFCINLSGWYKKNEEMPERKFYFAVQDELSLQQWTIFLEFARAKAIYDEFVNNFGKIQFPLGSQIESFDMAFKNDVYMKRRILYQNPASGDKTQDTRLNSSKTSVISRQSRNSKFMPHRQ